MNVELPPFKSGKRNSERASTIDRVITPLRTDQFSFEAMIENRYSFQKRSFSTIYWLTGDPGSGVRGTRL